MDKLNEFFDFIKSIKMSQVINWLIALAIIIAFCLVSSIISYGIVKLFFRKYEKEEIKKSNIYKTLKIFLKILGIYVASKVIELQQFQDEFIDKCFFVVVIWTLARLISSVFEERQILLEKLNKSAHVNNTLFTTVVSKVVKIVLYIIALYITLKEFGYDISGLATGLGLTGAVVALAAQDFIKQIISGLAIFTDKPFEIGDWVEIGEISGNVEDITIKSTRIRTIEDTIVIVPNDLVTSSNVINWQKIKKRVFRANIKLALETDESTVEKVLNRIRFILKYNEDIIAESISVQLGKIEEDALNIEIYLETTVTKYSEYRDFYNKINLTILNILESQGVELAYPGRNIYLKDSEKLKKSTTKTKPAKILK